MTNARIAKRAVVTGEVQGVFFRDSCRRVAEEHGVTGSARNLAGGGVEVVAEGDGRAVEALLEWCRRGPEGARVESVEVSDIEADDRSGFSTG